MCFLFSYFSYFVLCRRYLKKEWDSRHQISGSSPAAINYDPTIHNIPTIQVKAPRQPNGHDCGVYTIKFAELILREPPRTTPTIMNEQLGAYVHPESIRHSDVTQMRVDMRQTLEELNAQYIERLARLKREKEERRAKRMQEKAALVAAAAANPSSDAVENKNPNSNVLPSDDQTQSSTDTGSTVSYVGKKKAMSPVRAETAEDCLAVSSLDDAKASKFIEYPLSQPSKKLTERRPEQTLSSQNSDLVTVRDEFDAIFDSPPIHDGSGVSTELEWKKDKGEDVSIKDKKKSINIEVDEYDEEEIPRSRVASRASEAFKPSSSSSSSSGANANAVVKTAKKIKTPIETESDDMTQPQIQPDTIAAATQESVGSVSVGIFQNSSHDNDSVHASGSGSGSSSGRKRRKRQQVETSAATETLNSTQDKNPLYCFFENTLHNPNSSSAPDQASCEEAAAVAAVDSIRSSSCEEEESVKCESSNYPQSRRSRSRSSSSDTGL